MSGLERAISFAANVHAGQVDKAGAPYILHPLRVMLSVHSTEQRIAAVLHDVVEDCRITFDQLRNEGFSEVVVTAIAALTRREGESYEVFVERAARNPIAHAVKLADLRDNMDLTRIASPSEHDHERLAKYQRAVAILERP
jgi:(p)ppGpp synthase/HD superfamily hydrolase